MLLGLVHSLRRNARAVVLAAPRTARAAGLFGANATNAKRVSARGSKSTSYRTTRSSVAYCACGTSLLLLLLLLLALLLEDALLALERLLLTQELLLLAAQ